MHMFHVFTTFMYVLYSNDIFCDNKLLHSASGIKELLREVYIKAMQS